MLLKHMDDQFFLSFFKIEKIIKDSFFIFLDLKKKCVLRVNCHESAFNNTHKSRITIF